MIKILSDHVTTGGVCVVCGHNELAYFTNKRVHIKNLSYLSIIDNKDDMLFVLIKYFVFDESKTQSKSQLEIQAEQNIKPLLAEQLGHRLRVSCD